jgi:hypothetical protein
MRGSSSGFDRIRQDCLRQTHLPPRPTMPIINVPSQHRMPAGTHILEGVIPGG